MKITIITGSAKKKGATARLAEEFIKGATENGHEIYRFESHFKDVHFCLGCNHCNEGADTPRIDCVFKDDFVELRENILNSDIVVFVTPMYYFGFSGQIKRVIDRFYSIDTPLKAKKMKAVLISSRMGEPEMVAEPIKLHYQYILNWLNMESIGMLNIGGIKDAKDLDNTDYLKQAYELAKSI